MNVVKKKNFEELQLPSKIILDPFRFMKHEGWDNSLLIPTILSLINENGLKICDIGGASGRLLNELLLKSNHKLFAHILDIDNFYRNKVNKNIKFINASILNCSIEDNFFDIVVFRHFLHHLVSNNIKNTLRIQKHALNEIFRITKNEGYVIFIEQVNEVPLFSRIVYHLSKITNKFKINLKSFDAGKVIVYFLSQKAIRKMLLELKKNYNLEIKKEQFIHWYNHPLKWKLTILMSKIGSVFYIIKVLKEN